MSEEHSALKNHFLKLLNELLHSIPLRVVVKLWIKKGVIPTCLIKKVLYNIKLLAVLIYKKIHVYTKC